MNFVARVTEKKIIQRYGEIEKKIWHKMKHMWPKRRNGILEKCSLGITEDARVLVTCISAFRA